MKKVLRNTIKFTDQENILKSNSQDRLQRIQNNRIYERKDRIDNKRFGHFLISTNRELGDQVIFN